MKISKFKKSAAVILAAASFAAASGAIYFSEIDVANVQAASVDSFRDVQDKNKFFYSPVYWASSNKITTGFNDNTFRPDDTCTRGQAVTFLWRYENEPKPDTERYLSDTKNSSFKDSISWALSTGVTTGFNDGTFKQDNPCTRGQIVTFIWRAAGSPEVNSSNTFTDVSESSAFAKAINWAAKYGITTGFEDNTFRQDQTCTRGQIVTFLYRWSVLKGDVIESNTHPEDEAIMEQLREFYTSHVKVEGVPADVYDDTTKYIKYAIADFDGDGKNEVAIEDYYIKTSDIIISNVSYYKGDISDDNIIQWCRGVKISENTYLDNGIAYVTDISSYNSDVKGFYFILNKIYYDKLNYSKENLGSDTSTFAVYYFMNQGVLTKYLTDQIDVFFSEEKTQTEYEQEKQMLESGNVMNIEIKDFTAENIGL